MDIRNICIIAHVDHGKTTLVDHLLRQSGTFQKHQVVGERIMDSMDLEREKGITILAKNTSVRYGKTKINIVDTPGHGDFGGEVERILGMVDGAVLLVDAAEGPLPQTRFVLQKALSRGLKVILCINKVDRPECREQSRIHEVEGQAFDLFFELGASESQLEFPIIYACGREGWCTQKLADVPHLLSGEKKASLEPLFNLLVSYVPPPEITDNPDFAMLVSNLSYSDYVGRLAIGRVRSGAVTPGQTLYRLGIGPTGQPLRETFKATRVYSFEGLKQVETQSLSSGDIGIVAGIESFQIGDTLSSREDAPALTRIHVDPPTIGMIFTINTSPLSGQEGEAIQSRKLKERLLREVRYNVALRLEDTETESQFRVLGRGELQFAILIEQMRREGQEFMVGKPTVLLKTGPNGERLEPVELAVLDLPAEFVGEVLQLFQKRKGIVLKHEPFHLAGSTQPRVRVEIEIPTRGLLGLRSKYLTLTKGYGLMSTELRGYSEHRGQILHRVNGAMVADRGGKTVEYALLNLEERGVLFFGPGVSVYEGMIVGEHSQENDLNVNPCKEKKLTNVRAAHAEILVVLKGIRQMSLEQCLEWLDEDEWIEITPKSIRLRKKILSQQKRSVKRADNLGL